LGRLDIRLGGLRFVDAAVKARPSRQRFWWGRTLEIDSHVSAVDF